MMRLGNLGLTIHTVDPRWRSLAPPPESSIRRAARGLRGEPFLRAPNGLQVGVCLTNDAAIRQLNRRHRGVPRATDILSFPADPLAVHGDNREDHLGDLVLAFETMGRKGRLCGMTPADYLSFAVIHGILHLLGLDHACASAAGRMRAYEVRALARVGLAHPW